MKAPQHKVILTQPRFLGVHEVTQAHYEKVMGKNPSEFATTGTKKDAVAGMDTSNHPVDYVSWNDATEFCANLSQLEKLKPFYSHTGGVLTSLNGTGYRLPTEAEWEFACRAGTTTSSWFGDKGEDLVQAGWIGANSGSRTHAVRELKANPFGLYDMHGNVWESVHDLWDPTYYARQPGKPAVDPSCSSSTSDRRVLRGSHLFQNAADCRSSSRHALVP